MQGLMQLRGPGGDEIYLEAPTARLMPLEIVTPEVVNLYENGCKITVTNPNSEAVSATVQVTCMDFDENVDPVLEAVVNPKPRRGKGGPASRPFVLEPGEIKEIEVRLQSKQGPGGTPTPEDMITEKLGINVTLTPVNLDSNLKERDFPAIYRDVKLEDVFNYTSSASLIPDVYDGGLLEISYVLKIPGIEFQSSNKNPEAVPTYASEATLKILPYDSLLGKTYTETFEGRLPDRRPIIIPIPLARTCEGNLPLKLKLSIEIAVAPECHKMRKRYEPT